MITDGRDVDEILEQEEAIIKILVERCCHTLGGKHKTRHHLQAEEIRRYYKRNYLLKPRQPKNTKLKEKV